MCKSASGAMCPGASARAVLEQQLEIAVTALRLIQEDAGRPADPARQAMCAGLASNALASIELVQAD